MTWYDILGIAPGAAAETVRRAYHGKAEQLRSYQIDGAPAQVIQAVARGQAIIDAAWLILGNRTQRDQYDEHIGIRKATGLTRPELAASRPGSALLDAAGDALYAADAAYSGDVLEGLGVLADLLAAIPRRQLRRSPYVIVPDVRGLLFRACTDGLTMAGFRLTTVRLTQDPMPVEGLVVGQSPSPGQSVLRFSTVTVQVWHPPRSLRGCSLGRPAIP